MKKNNVLVFVLGFAVATATMISFPSFAEGVLKTLQVGENSVKVKVNGVLSTSSNYVIEGRTYLQVRDMCNLLDKDLVWDDATKTLSINDKIVKVPETNMVPTKDIEDKSTNATKPLISIRDLPEITIEEVYPADKDDVDKMDRYRKSILLFSDISNREELYNRIKTEFQSRRNNFILCFGGDANDNFSSLCIKEELDENDVVKNILKRIFKEDPYLEAITNYAFNANIGQINFSCSYLEGLSETRYVKEKVKQILGEIIKPKMSDLEKEETINRWICENVSYDEFTDKKSAYTALKSPYITVCTGYTILAYEMLTQAGIKTEIITGNATGNSLFSSGHAWNKVFVNNQWYHLDVTWNKTSDNFMKYFNKDDIEMAKTHSW